MTSHMVTAPRRLIEDAVLERAQHASLSRAQDTWSFARAERLLGKEYHGRFLIELLQNAADAWRKANPDGSLCDLVVVLDETPALVVANRGGAFPASIVLESLGQIGLSSKEAGEAIGHKGIGFKSTLEISNAPEIYSGFHESAPQLAVRFDAERARDTIRDHSPSWDEWVSQQREFQNDPLQAIPILRYPVWVESVPEVVTALGHAGYDTVVRLGYSAALGPEKDWLDKVRTAMQDISDQILVLLRLFESIRIEDRVAGTVQNITVSLDSGQQIEGMLVEKVTIFRDGACSSNWMRYHRQLVHEGDLASEITSAFRLDADDPLLPVRAHDDPDASSPFHLFFPTRIGSGLPFLVHGYFEVDAARTGFFTGSVESNRAIMDALADLVIEAVAHLTKSHEDLDLLAFAELVATAPRPETPLAKSFYERVLAGLDHVAWLPGAPGSPRCVSPISLLPIDRDVTAALIATFPVAYLRERCTREIAHPGLSDEVHRFLDQRRDESDDLWDALHVILRPGDSSPWPTDAGADAHLLSLLDLIDALKRRVPSRDNNLIVNLIGDDEARLIPVTRPDGQRSLVAVPDPDSSKPGARRVAVMARLGDTNIRPLDPPQMLDVEFVADGLLTEQARARAEVLGIRPFTVDAVLDRLTPSVSRRDDQDRAHMFQFLWDLLTRERRSDFSTLASSERALTYANYRWFWLVPGRARGDDSQQQRQRRERNLAHVHLPAADGTWRPATDLTFGADWADWVEANISYADAGRRAAGMRQLSRLAPGPGALLAAPEVVLQYLPLASLDDVTDDFTSEDDDTEEGPPYVDEDDSDATDVTQRSQDVDVAADSIDGKAEIKAGRAALEQLAFLLRLGCWEILPIEGHQTGRPTPDTTWPWPEVREALARGDDPQEWNFDVWQWNGIGHRKITVAEDARFKWPLERTNHDSRHQMSKAVADGAELYASLAEASAFCPGCTTPAGNYHSKRYRTNAGERRPSTLTLQLHRQAWLPTTIAGAPVDGHSADDAWADLRGLDSHMMRTSPLQHLPLVDASDWSPALRLLCGLQTLDDAAPARLLSLHVGLRSAFEESREHFAGNGRQSFVGLHRLIYEALSANDPDQAFLEDFEVLCELGSNLVHRLPAQCRHDDGKHVAHRPRFAGRVPFVVLARDKTAVARGLGVQAFEVIVERQGSDQGEDITDQLRHELTDRIPELLAVMVHHAGGTNPLDPTGDAFRERANRLRNLRVRRLENLVLVVSVVDMPEIREVVGDSNRDESYLETARGGRPIIFHDIAGDGWRTRLSRRLAAHLAAVCDVAGTYSDTFTLLLTADDADREDLLRSWGVLPEHIHQIRAQLGIYTDTDHTRTVNWLAALLEVLGHPGTAVSDAVDHEGLTAALTEAGLVTADAEVVAYGIASDRPGDRNGPVIRTLDRHGVGLGALSEALTRRHEPRLTIGVAGDRLRDWCDRHGQRVVAALANSGVEEATAKAEVAALAAASDLNFVLEPTPEQYLSAVVSLLGRHGMSATSGSLALDAPQTIADLLGCEIAELDQWVRELYDDEARIARLADLAGKWARELKLLALLARASGASAAVIRDEAQQIDELLGRPRSPSVLQALLPELLAGDQFMTLRDALESKLTDDLPGEPPDRVATLALSERHGLSSAAAEQVLSTLRRDQSKRVGVYTHQIRALIDTSVSVNPPVGLEPAPAPRRRSGGRRFVVPGTVSVGVERRKKQIGDEAESWALTAVTKTLLDLDDNARNQAIESIVDMLKTYGFVGTAIDRVHAHARAAREANLDQESLIDRITELLHVAAYSDGFGFDVLGWILDPIETAGGYPIALEVKAASGSFFFSSGEWSCAERMRATEDTRAAYAVLAVRRDLASGTPNAMDLLIDPVQLCEDGKIHRDVDTYRMRYKVQKTSESSGPTS